MMRSIRMITIGLAVSAIGGCSALLPKFEIHQGDSRFLEEGTESRTYSENNLLTGLRWDFAAEAGHMIYMNPIRVVKNSGDRLIGFTVKHQMKHATTEAPQMMLGPTEVIFIADGERFTHEVRIDYDVYSYESMGTGILFIPEEEYCRIALADELTVKVGWMIIEDEHRHPPFQKNLLTFDNNCGAATRAALSAEAR